MSDIQKEIKEALKESEGISLSNFHLATREQGKAHDKVRNNAPVWISHLLELIEQLQDRNRHLQGMFDSQNKTAQMYYETIQQKDAEIARLAESLKRIDTELTIAANGYAQQRDLTTAHILDDISEIAENAISQLKGANT